MKDGSLRKYNDSFMTGILEEIIGIKPDVIKNRSN